MPLRRLILLILVSVLVTGIFVGWFERRGGSSRQPVEKPPAVTIIKQPVTFASRTFDPANPPPDMPSLGPGEEAECDTNFLSDASVTGESRKTDATHAILTVTHINVMLQINITIWVPTEVTQHVIEHEEGHRQISEYYYQDADKLAERIAESYVSKQVEITGTDLNTESSKALQQMAAGITDEYNKELSPGPTQQLYDEITDHSRNDVVAKDAVAGVIQRAEITWAQPATNPGN